jgi:glycosyltransferase involved in cell wall biosynthesis
VGRIAREKNPELVMCAFSLVADEHRDARLLVVGGGPYLDECRERARHLRNGERIVFAGPIPHEELTPIYATADLFVFGSSTETQGLVIAEARAAGTPAVVVTGGGASETVRNGEDGLVVQPELGEFAEAIRFLLGDSERLKRFAAACRRNAAEFTPGAMTERIVGVYERARAGASQPPGGTEAPEVMAGAACAPDNPPDRGAA